MAGRIQGQKLEHWATWDVSFPEFKTPSFRRRRAIIGNDEDIMDRCNSYHNCGRPFGNMKTGSGYLTGNELQDVAVPGLILMSQMKRIEKDNDIRLQMLSILTS